jgi:hypothetical protein
MAKNKATAEGHHPGGNVQWVKRDSSNGRFLDKKSDSKGKGVRREILFPTEPSTIGHKRIDRAVEFVVSRKK